VLAVEFRVLGPVEVVADDGLAPIGGPRPRTIVAVLALRAGQPIATERLVQEVWGEDAPRSAVDTLQSYVSRLRSTLGPGRLGREPGGYLLRAEPSEVDAATFRGLVGEARRLVDAGRGGDGAGRFRQALARWRGPVADGLDHGPAIRAAAAQLTELRLAATEECFDAELALGRHSDLTGEIEALLEAHPLRERLHAQLMVALYRAGRQADALAAYGAAREALVDGLGIEPSGELRRVHRRILDQDPALDHRPARADVPTPVAASGSAGNLPALFDEFVGRAGERSSVADLLGEARLVTLTGAGGCGKTQLALRVADDVSPSVVGPAWFVELAAHPDPRVVDRVVAAALGVPESGDLRGAVARRIGDRRMLLIVDNCEHLVDAVAELVGDLLHACPRLRVLATSREPLDLPGERAWRVPSLTLPPGDADAETLRSSDAGRLFEVRARAVRPDFRVDHRNATTVARICRELDGIPLALELAAARLSVLSESEIADRLGERFGLLTGGRRTAPARHRTLQAAIDWSYDLLAPPEQRLLRYLSVFAGGFTLDAVEGVCAGEGVAAADVLQGMAALVDKSLAHRIRAGAPPARHDLLEPVRSYADGRLSDGERRRLQARHTEFYVGLAERAEPALTGPDQVAWLNRLHLEHDNLRAVLARGTPDAARVAAAVWWFWLQFGHVGEGDRWLSGVLADGGPADPVSRLRLRLGAGRLARARGDLHRAAAQLDESLQIATDLGDEVWMARSWAELGLVVADDDAALARTRVERGRALFAEGDGWVVATLEEAAGVVAWRGGRLEAAAQAFAASERGYQEAGDEWSACLARLGAARVARQQDDLDVAARLHRENLARSLDLTVSTLDFVGLPQDLQGLAAVAARDGDFAHAALLMGAAAALRTAVELPLQRFERAEQARILEGARAALGRDAAESTYRRGRSLSAEAAVHDALGERAVG
jgi:predicted ATPase/DNA-binding SARP family transcriptional activator